MATFEKSLATTKIPLCVFFTCVCGCGIFILDYICIETKGKTTEEIDNAYRNFKYKMFKAEYVLFGLVLHIYRFHAYYKIH